MSTSNGGELPADISQERLTDWQGAISEQDSQLVSVAYALTPEFWGISQTELDRWYSLADERDLDTVSPRHLQNVLFRDGEYYGADARYRLDGFACTLSEIDDTIFSPEKYEERVSSRYITAKKDKNRRLREPEFDPFRPGEDNKRVASKVNESFMRPRPRMVALVEELAEEETLLSFMESLSKQFDRDIEWVDGKTMRSGIESTLRGSFAKMIEAAGSQFQWDLAESQRMVWAMGKRIFNHPQKEGYWYTMLTLAKAWTIGKRGAVQRRIDELDRITGASQEVAS